MSRLRWVLVVAAVLAVVGWPVPAHAGGSHMQPVRDRYEVGEVAVLVGYTVVRQPEVVSGGPYRAYLQVGDQRTSLGDLEVNEVRRGNGFAEFRVSLRFTVPNGLPPGGYGVGYCVDPCTGAAYLGDIVGGTVFVGVDPPYPIARGWPLDEPEVANLDGAAFLVGPGYRTTAAAVRAGEPLAADPSIDSAPPERPTPPPATTPPTFAITRAPLPPRPDPSQPPAAPLPLIALGATVVSIALAAAYLRARAGRGLRSAGTSPHEVGAVAGSASEGATKAYEPVSLVAPGLRSVD